MLTFVVTTPQGTYTREVEEDWFEAFIESVETSTSACLDLGDGVFIEFNAEE